MWMLAFKEEPVTQSATALAENTFPGAQTAVARQRTREDRLEYIDGIRGFAALVVFVNHVFQQVYWNQPNQYNHLSLLLQFGHAAVVVFIVLSGFCLMRPVLLNGSLRGGTKAFYRGRARRILPAYFGAVLITMLLIVTLIGQKRDVMFDLSLPVTWRGLLAHLLLLNNLWPPPYFGSAGNTEIASVFWSIALEWQIYFFFPLFVTFWLRYGRIPTLTLIIIVFGTIWRITGLLFPPGTQASAINWSGINADFYVYFALGMLSADIILVPRQGSRPVSSLWKWAFLCLLAGVVLIHEFGRFGHLLGGSYTDLVTALAALSLLVACSQPGILKRCFSWRPLVALGLFSYSFYLLHLPILSLFTDYVSLPLRGLLPFSARFVLLLMLTLPAVTGIAYIFSRAFENKTVLQRMENAIRLRIFGSSQ
jgi:peptidoglycan/LPS O-acetylase OafA/YrhL